MIEGWPIANIIRTVFLSHPISRTKSSELSEIARLARLIWHAHYPEIIPVDQIDYMLERMYSLERMQQEIQSEAVVYFHAGSPGSLLGFAAVGPTSDPHEFKLHKLYVRPECQRQGYGKALLGAVEGHARQAGAARLILSVNKRNAKALRAYDTYGFRRRSEVCISIGDGYVMDDFILERDLDIAPPEGDE